MLETACSAVALKPEASVREAIQVGVKAGIDEGVLTQELIVDYLGSDLTPEQAKAVVYINLASEIPGASPCSFLSIAIKAYQNSVDGLPVMWQFYGPLYLAHGIDPRGEEAEKLLDPVPSCLMQSSQAVAGRAWPEADRAEVGRLRQSDNIQVYGKIKLPGQEEFYLTRGELAGEDGLMYIAASQVGLVGNCDDVVDLSPLADNLESPPDNEVGPLIINLPEKTCTFKVKVWQAVRLCSDIDGTRCRQKVNRYGGQLINKERTLVVTKITDDGRAYVEGAEDDDLLTSTYFGWVPARRNVGDSLLSLVGLAGFGGVNYPDVSTCLSKYYEE